MTPRIPTRTIVAQTIGQSCSSTPAGRDRGRLVPKEDVLSAMIERPLAGCEAKIAQMRGRGSIASCLRFAVAAAFFVVT